jgi:hypothetical protein
MRQKKGEAMARLNVRLRTVFIVGCGALGLAAAALSTPVSAQQAPKTYAIASEDLGVALRAFALASGRDVVFDPVLVKGKTTRGVQGELGEEEALRQLLTDTGLSFERTATGGLSFGRLQSRLGTFQHRRWMR